MTRLSGFCDQGFHGVESVSGSIVDFDPGDQLPPFAFDYTFSGSGPRHLPHAGPATRRGRPLVSTGAEGSCFGLVVRDCKAERAES